MRRWIAFNVVGVVGFVVQLAVLAALLQSRVPYLVATVVAVEAAVLHNFWWHDPWTWSDRAASCSRTARLLRFHLTNGAVSLVGNTAATWLLVRFVHLPPLFANAIAVFACSLANFTAADGLVFPVAPRGVRSRLAPFQESGLGSTVPGVRSGFALNGGQVSLSPDSGSGPASNNERPAP